MYKILDLPIDVSSASRYPLKGFDLLQDTTERELSSDIDELLSTLKNNEYVQCEDACKDA